MDAADALPPHRLHRPRPGPPGPPRTIRMAAWRGRHDVILLAPRGGASPSTDDVRAALRTAAQRGVRHAVTGALGPTELDPFLAVGFTVRERLHLLRHDLIDLDPVPPHPGRIRRAHPRDHSRALDVDARAFDPFWRLDRDGLDDALRATTATRFRVAANPEVVGYAVTGRAGRQGYVQRLAVDPRRRGEGLGRALVLDGLHWLRRRQVATTVVNTQVGNETAFALYRALGFVPEPDGLTVLARPIGPPS